MCDCPSFSSAVPLMLGMRTTVCNSAIIASDISSTCCSTRSRASLLIATTLRASGTIEHFLAVAIPDELVADDGHSRCQREHQQTGGDRRAGCRHDDGDGDDDSGAGNEPDVEWIGLASQQRVQPVE